MESEMEERKRGRRRRSGGGGVILTAHGGNTKGWGGVGHFFVAAFYHK